MEVVFTLTGLGVAVGMYFLPTLVAVVRKVPNTASVVVVNLFLGWTMVGWVVALAMAARTTYPPPARLG